MHKSISSALCVVAVCAAAITPSSAVAAGDTATDPASTTTVTNADGTTTAVTPTGTEGLTLTPDQVQAIQDQQAAETADEDRSVFEKASDYVSDHAPFFIIGIIVLAAILAGFFISRGRRKPGPETAAKGKGKPVPPAAKAAPVAAAASAPASVPSTKELRRRKRAAAQQAREEERLRRKAGYDGRRRSAPAPAETPVGPLVSASTATLALDPMEAEKRAAKGLPVQGVQPPPAPAPAAPAPPAAAAPKAAAARPSTGAIPAPVSPSQTAPAAGIQTPAQAAAGYPDDTIYSKPSEASAGAAASSSDPAEPPTQVQQPRESAIEAPAPDARVGEAAAAFAAGAAGGSVAARAASVGDSEEQPVEGSAADLAGTDLVDSGDEPVADTAPNPDQLDPDDRLRAKVEEIKSGRPGLSAAVPAAAVAAAASAPKVEDEPEVAPEPEAEAVPEADRIAEEDARDLERRKLEAEAVQTEIEGLEPSAVSAAGLDDVGRRLEENRKHRDEALQQAEDRLRRIEERAEHAERRAAFAERLTQLNVEESEREQRLNDMLSGIDRAEERAREAELRAEAAEKAAAAALQGQVLSERPSPAPSEAAAPPRGRVEWATPPAGDTPSAAGVPAEPAESPASTESTEAETAPEAAPADEAPAEPSAAAAAAPQKQPTFTEATPKPNSPFNRLFTSDSTSSGLNLNTATFEQLREADLSVTQATRILAYRERFGGYTSVDDLEKVPGFPEDVIESLRDKITV